MRFAFSGYFKYVFVYKTEKSGQENSQDAKQETGPGDDVALKIGHRGFIFINKHGLNYPEVIIK